MHSSVVQKRETPRFIRHATIGYGIATKRFIVRVSTVLVLNTYTRENVDLDMLNDNELLAFRRAVVQVHSDLAASKNMSLPVWRTNEIAVDLGDDTVIDRDKILLEIYTAFSEFAHDLHLEINISAFGGD